MIGAAAVIILFGLLGYRGMMIASRASDRFGMMVAVGISTWIMFQALFNIGGVSAAIPFTGITLPFISYGGSSMIVSMAAVGILLNVSRQTVDLPATQQSQESSTQGMVAAGPVTQMMEPSMSADNYQQLDRSTTEWSRKW